MSQRIAFLKLLDTVTDENITHNNGESILRIADEYKIQTDELNTLIGVSLNGPYEDSFILRAVKSVDTVIQENIDGYFLTLTINGEFSTGENENLVEEKFQVRVHAEEGGEVSIERFKNGGLTCSILEPAAIAPVLDRYYM